MNMIYNSPHFCVVEFHEIGRAGDHPAGGYEIMDKHMRREIFLGGKDAEAFRKNVKELIASEPTEDQVDEFLGAFSSLMTQPVVLH